LGERTLIAVFASPVADQLLHFGQHLGFHCILVEPNDPDARPDPSFAGPEADIVVTDHDRSELGEILRSALATPARWIGVMGSPRHAAQHIPALQALGVPDDDIARVQRPIGLNIGSKSPAEIAVSTLAGLIASRNQRPGGFSF
jgi:xanthine/CO dehydrogenase XdhC/CoxF family maturation factor